MNSRPLEYRGKQTYPLLDHGTGCTKCIFGYRKASDERQCGYFTKDAQKILGVAPDDHGICIDVYWAEGPAAQTQYILERLTS